MDSSVWALIITLSIDLIIFITEFNIFSIYRKVRNKPVYLELSSKEIKLPVFSESDTPLLDLMHSVWNVPYEEIGYACGLEGKLYLALQKTLAKTVLLMALFGCPVLVPIYYFMGTDDVKKEMYRFGMGHIIEDSNLMPVVLIYFFLFTAIPLGGIFMYIKEVSTAYAMPSELSCNINKYTLEIRGLPHDIPPYDAALEIKDIFLEQFPESILSIYVPPDLSTSYTLDLEIKEAKQELMHYNEYLRVKNTRATLRHSLFKTIDAIEYYQKLIDELSLKQLKEHEAKKKHCSGFAFVLCKTPAETFKIMKNFKKTTDFLQVNSWKILKAPAPGEINWHNFTEHKKSIWIVRVALFLLFFVFFFLLVTPAAILQILKEFFISLGFGDITDSVLSNYLPSIILLLYQSAIVRHTVLAIVKREELPNKSEETVSCLFKYLLVMTTYTFIVPLVGLQVYNLITDTFVGGFDEIKHGIFNKAASSGLFFTIFIMQLSFLKCGSDLLQIPKYFRVFFRQLRAVNDRERLMAYEAYEFRWAYEYGVSINAFVVIMAFSVAYPLILPFGAFFYTFRYFTAKYNLLCFYCTVKTTTGHKVPKMITSGILTAVLIFQLFTCFMISLSGSITYIALAVSLVVLSCVLFLILYYFREKIEPQIQASRNFAAIEDEEGFIVGEDINRYYNPLDLNANGSRILVNRENNIIP